jgi:hypothetical protein
VTRRRHLADLAAVMHVPPPVVNQLTIADFTQLITDIPQRKAEMAQLAGLRALTGS